MKTIKPHQYILVIFLLIFIFTTSGVRAKENENNESEKRSRVSDELNNYNIFPWELLKKKDFRSKWIQFSREKNLPTWIRSMSFASSKDANYFCFSKIGNGVVYTGNKVHDGSESVKIAYFPQKNIILLIVGKDYELKGKFSSEKNIPPVEDFNNNFCEEI